MGLNSSSNTGALRFMAQLGVQDVVLKHVEISDCGDLLLRQSVRDLLREMSVRKGGASKRKYLAERRTFSYSSIHKRLGENTERWVRRLVNGGILHRGADVRCETCGISQWQHIDELTNYWICKGCRTTQPLPINYSTTSWKSVTPLRRTLF